MLVLFPLVLCCTKGNDSGPSVPPPPTPNPVNPGGGDKPGETHPWDANRGKVVRPQPGNGWTVTTIEDGVVYYAFDGKESITNTNQHIYVTDIDLAKPYSIKLGYYNPTTTASKVFAANNAVAVINCGYEKAALYLKVNGTTISTITASTIGSTDVPQWKSEAALYLNQNQDVRIEFTGKDMTLAQWRTTYAERAKSESTFITSAPMLIDDFEPVGESFCDKHPKDQWGSTSSSENPYNHQGSDTNPRTAIAKTEDNHVLLIVVDGRRNGFAKGISAKNLTKFLVNNFNPQYALNLDGGGSSTMCVKGQGDPETHVVNYPCDNRSEDKNGSPKETNGPDHAGERPRDTFIMVLKK